MRSRRLKYGLHRKTYKTIYILLAFIIVISIIGRTFKLQENITAHFYNKSNAYAKELKDLKTYKEPTISENEKARALYIIQKIWRKDWKIGVAIASCESGYREKIINSIGATGYFQIMHLHGMPTSDMQNGWANAGFAYALYKEQGLSPWLSSRGCWIQRI